MQRECVHGRQGRGQTVFIVGRETGRNDRDQPVTQVEARHPLFYRGWPVRFCPVESAC